MDTVEDDYYELLQIPMTATEEQISKSYRKLSLVYHPDRNPDPNAAHMFHKLKTAVELLKDPKLRKEYDDKIQGRLLRAKQDAVKDVNIKKQKEALDRREKEAQQHPDRTSSDKEKLNRIREETERIVQDEKSKQQGGSGEDIILQFKWKVSSDWSVTKVKELVSKMRPKRFVDMGVAGKKQRLFVTFSEPESAKMALGVNQKGLSISVKVTPRPPEPVDVGPTPTGGTIFQIQPKTTSGSTRWIPDVNISSAQFDQYESDTLARMMSAMQE